MTFYYAFKPLVLYLNDDLIKPLNKKLLNRFGMEVAYNQGLQCLHVGIFLSRKN